MFVTAVPISACCLYVNILTDYACTVYVATCMHANINSDDRSFDKRYQDLCRKKKSYQGMYVHR